MKFKLLLALAAASGGAGSFLDHSWPGKEGKPRKGSGLPVQMEAVAGPVEVSTQEG